MPVLDSHPLRNAFIAADLERLASVIVQQGEDLLRDAGLDFPPRAASTILLLGERGPMTAADLARVLEQPHQLVTQRVELLLERGVVTRTGDPADARRRILRLTPKGRRQFDRLQLRLAEASAAFAALYRETGCDLAGAVDGVLAALARSPLLDRVRTLPPSRP